MVNDWYMGANIQMLMEMRREMRDDKAFLEWFMEMADDTEQKALVELFKDEPYGFYTKED